jgi:hypothetical protein
MTQPVSATIAGQDMYSRSEATVLIDWLMHQGDYSPLDVNRQHLEIASQATPGTGNWILDNEEIQQWRDPSISSSRCLGIHGIRELFHKNTGTRKAY